MKNIKSLSSDTCNFDQRNVGVAQHCTVGFRASLSPLTQSLLGFFHCNSLQFPVSNLMHSLEDARIDARIAIDGKS